MAGLGAGNLALPALIAAGKGRPGSCCCHGRTPDGTASPRRLPALRTVPDRPEPAAPLSSGEALMSVREAARALRVSPGDAEGLIAAGVLSRVYEGRTPMVTAESVSALLASRDGMKEAAS